MCGRYFLLFCFIFALSDLFNVHADKRLVKEDDMTSVLVSAPMWFREVYYRLDSRQQTALRLIDPADREKLVQNISSIDGRLRAFQVKNRLSATLKEWSQQGFEVGDQLRAKSSVNDEKNVSVSESTVNSNNGSSGAEEKADFSGAAFWRESPEDYIRERKLKTFWRKIFDFPTETSSPMILQVFHSTADDSFQLKKASKISPTGAMPLLPLFTADGNISHIIQFNEIFSEMSPSELITLPDQVFRVASADQLSSISPDLLVALIRLNAGDVSLTGTMAELLPTAGSGSLVNSAIDEKSAATLSTSEKRVFVQKLTSQWLESLNKPTSRTHSFSSLCVLANFIPLEQLLKVPPQAVAHFVQQCARMWLNSSHSHPSLGRFSRVWLEKMTETQVGSISHWSADDLAEKSVLLSGALSNELVKIPSDRKIDASTAITFVDLDRSQAQPVLDVLLDTLPLPSLRGLLRHLQPRHIRMAHKLIDQLHDAPDWMFAIGQRQVESTPFSTLVQARLILGDLPKNATTSDLVRLGKFLFTLPLHEIYTIYARNIHLTPDLLHKIISPQAEPVALRMMMTLYMQQQNTPCNTCLDQVPSNMLSNIGDTLMYQLRSRGHLTPHVTRLLASSADQMLVGKRALLLDTVRYFIRRPSSVNVTDLLLSESLWSMMNPKDLEAVAPQVMNYMQNLAQEGTYEDLLILSRRFPRKMVSFILDYVLANSTNSRRMWSSENMLPIRSGRTYTYGWWVFLNKLDCHHIEAIDPLDIIPLAEEIERQLLTLGEKVMSLDICVCLKRKIVNYLRLKHILNTPGEQNNAENLLQQRINVTDAPLSPLSTAEAYAIPPCILMLFSRSYLENQPYHVRMVIWQRIANMNWPQLLQHIYIQRSSDDFKWAARRVLADLGLMRVIKDNNGSVSLSVTRLNFQQISSVNQLLHFVGGDVIEQIPADVFRRWVYTLRTSQERLVCGPHSSWAGVLRRAFGDQPHLWSAATIYRLGGWIFALNSTDLASINRQTLRLSLDAHLATLFSSVPDVIDGADGQPLSFVAACGQLNTNNFDLRAIFEAAMLGGVVGAPVPPTLQSSTKNQSLEKQMKSLNVSLQSQLDSALHSNATYNALKSEMSETIGGMLNELHRESIRQTQLKFEFWSRAPLRCEDLRSAGDAAVAVTTEEINTMTSAELWSCLGHLGSLDWRKQQATAEAVWRRASKMLITSNSPGPLSSEHVVTLGNLVSLMKPKELSKIALLQAAAEWTVSTDALSVLGSQRWTSEQLSSLLTDSLRIYDDRSVSLIQLYSDPVHISAMGSLLCGLTDDQLDQLFNNTAQPNLYLETSSSVGQRALCDDARPLHKLAEYAVSTYGETGEWSQLTVETVGVVAAGLTRAQFTSLSPAALRGLQPHTAYRIVAKKDGLLFTPEQLQQLQPVTARQLLSSSQLSSQHIQALKWAIIGGDGSEHSAVSHSHNSTNTTAQFSESAKSYFLGTGEGAVNPNASSLPEEVVFLNNNTARQAKIQQAGKGGAAVATLSFSALYITFFFLSLTFFLY